MIIDINNNGWKIYLSTFFENISEWSYSGAEAPNTFPSHLPAEIRRLPSPLPALQEKSLFEVHDNVT